MGYCKKEIPQTSSILIQSLPAYRHNSKSIRLFSAFYQKIRQSPEIVLSLELLVSALTVSGRKVLIITLLQSGFRNFGSHTDIQILLCIFTLCSNTFPTLHNLMQPIQSEIWAYLAKQLSKFSKYNSDRSIRNTNLLVISTILVAYSTFNVTPIYGVQSKIAIPDKALIQHFSANLSMYQCITKHSEKSLNLFFSDCTHLLKQTLSYLLTTYANQEVGHPQNQIPIKYLNSSLEFTMNQCLNFDLANYSDVQREKLKL